MWIAAIASSRKSLATQTAAICVHFQGRRVRHEYVTMHITFLTRKSALIYRRGLRQRVASLTLDCNGVFAIRAYRRTGQHPFGGGGANRFLPEWIPTVGGGGSSRNFPGSIICGGKVVGDIFRGPCAPDSVGGGVMAAFFPLTAVTYPMVIQPCFVFCPNNVDSVRIILSTNSPNWGGNCPPSRTPMIMGK